MATHAEIKTYNFNPSFFLRDASSDEGNPPGTDLHLSGLYNTPLSVENFWGSSAEMEQFADYLITMGNKLKQSIKNPA